MKVYAATALLFLFFSVSLDAQERVNTIIPKPASAVTREGIFTIDDQTVLVTDTPLSLNAGDYLQHQLLLNAGFMLTVKEGAHRNGLHYQIDKRLEDEAYRLHITPEKIQIEAGSPSGFFYATVTLMQLMDPTIWSQQRADTPKKQWTLPACTIEDAPRFRWRGMMLDSARNFFSVEYVKKFIDRMAQHKLNVFHWHLTDDEGWRIEIKKYPLLTGIGSRRGPGTAMPYSFFPSMRGAKVTIEAGYYTQDDIREIVAYAAKRSVNVLPEIDVPAHAKAAVTAYPLLLQDPNDLSRYTSVQKVANNTIDPGLAGSYLLMENVVQELTQLFPFRYVHLGGDEIPNGAWQRSPSVARLMQEEDLHNTKEIKAYFFSRMETILSNHHRQMIIWHEKEHDYEALGENTVLMAWRGSQEGINAAKAHRQVIMAPAQYLYFDQQYVKNADEPGHTWAGPTDTRTVYRYDPTAPIADRGTRSFIEGVHGCLWSERAPTEAIADYLAWPRIFALAEIGWSPQKKRHWNDFEQRVRTSGVNRLKVQKIHYRSILQPRSTLE